jgi:hypothetical protein
MENTTDKLVTLMQLLENNGAEFEDNNLAFEIIQNTFEKIINCKLEEMKTKLPAFLYNDRSGIFIGYHGDALATDEWFDYIESFKEKAETP